jgi:hypothetical protein
VVAVLLVAFFLGMHLSSNWPQVRDANVVFSASLLASSAVLLAVYFVGRVLVWQFLTARNGIALPLPGTFAAWMYSQLGKYLPGKVFLLLARVYLYGQRGKSRALVTVTFAIETVATLSASVFVMLLALVVADFGQLNQWRAVLIGALLLFSIALHPRFLGWAFNLLLKLFRRPTVALPLTYRDTLKFVVLYILNYSILGLAFFVLIASFYDIEAGYLLYLAASFSLASLLGMLSVFVPSGLGVREGLLIFMLQQIMPVEIAIIAALVARLWFTGVELACIGITYVVTHTHIPRRRDLARIRGEPAEAVGDYTVEVVE